MVRVSVEVRSGTSSFGAVVLAQNIQQALNLVHASYPGATARVLFPIDGETFFAKGPLPASGMVLPELAEKAAG